MLRAVVVAVVALLAAAWLLRWFEPGDVQLPVPAEPRTHDGSPRSAAERAPARSGPSARSPGAPTGVAAPPALQRVSLAGEVVEASGQPVPRAWVTSADGGRTRADGRGRFRLTRLARPDEAARMTQLLVTANGREPALVAARWGTRGHRVTTAPAGLLSIEVVDAATGRPVEGYRAQLVTAAEAALRPDPVVLEGGDELGRLEARVEVGSPALLRVVATDEVHAPSALHRVTLDPTRSTTARVPLPRWLERTVTVSDDQGRPVAGAQVELLTAPPGLTVDAATPTASSWRDHADSRASLLATGVTDSRGRAVVRAPSHGPVTLRAVHPDSGFAVVRMLARDLAADDRVALQLQR